MGFMAETWLSPQLCKSPALSESSFSIVTMEGNDLRGAVGGLHTYHTYTKGLAQPFTPHVKSLVCSLKEALIRDLQYCGRGGGSQDPPGFIIFVLAWLFNLYFHEDEDRGYVFPHCVPTSSTQ